MESLLKFFRKLWLFIRRERFNRDLSEEIAFHREQAAQRLQEAGMSEDSAHYAAARQFGNEARVKEKSNEMVGFQFETALQDFRYAVRQLRKSPGFAFVAILVLALGTSASIAIFAFVDATLIKPLPYANPTRLVDVAESHALALIPRSNLSLLDYLDWKRLNTVFSSMDAHTGSGALLRTKSGTEVVLGSRVTAGFFETLGVQPLLGRTFHPGEDATGAPAVVVLSYSTWQKRFGGRSDVIGETVSLSDVPNTIIGVLPRKFEFAPEGQAEFWSALQPGPGCESRRSCHNLYAVARLKDGVSLESALAEMKVIASDLEKQFPDSNRGQSASLQPLSELIVGDVRPILLVLLAAAVVLLLIASVNVASLLLVRSESRKREVAVRGALGASRVRLIRQFVTEALVLVTGGSTLGLAVAYVSMQLLTRLIPPDKAIRMPYLQGAGLNLRVLIFAAAIALLSVLLFSITPMLRLPLSEIRDGLSEAGRGAAGTVWRRLGSNLVVVELTLAMMLLVSAGLLGKSLYRLLHVDLGFEPDHVATLRVAGPDANYGKPEQALALARRVVERLTPVPGVRSVALATILPVNSNGNTVWLRFLDRPFNGEHNDVNQRIVSSEYFTTLRAQLLRGRYFTEADEANKPSVIVINEALANKYFPGEDPVGKKVVYQSFATGIIREIVGVVKNIREGDLDSELWPSIYLPFNQNPNSGFAVLVRTSQDEGSVLPAVSGAIHEIDPEIAIRDEATMNGRINASQSAYLHRSAAVLVGGFAAMALLLGVIGLYGVVAYSVSQRTREIGVRMALGAERRSVYQLILKEAGWLTILGINAGVVFSLMTTSLIRKLLFGVRSWDVPTLFAVAAVLGVAALAASFLPARRAASVNPIEALRTE